MTNEHEFAKAEVSKAYDLDERGIIRSPGKFEGEPWYVTILWDLACEGSADDEIMDGDTPVSVFALDHATRIAFGLQACEKDFVLVWERDDGFVCSRKMTRERYDLFVADCATCDE